MSKVSKYTPVVLAVLLVIIPACATVGFKLCSVTRARLNGYGMISGQVVYKKTGEVLHHANVWIVGTKIRSVADEAGFYKLKEVPPGVYTIGASFIGLAKQEYKGLHLGRDSVIVLNFFLDVQVVRPEDVI